MSEVQYFEVDNYGYDEDFEGLDHDRVSEARSEYVAYLLSKLKTASSFNDWHEQTYGKSVTDTVIDGIMHELEEEFGDEAGDFLLNLHRR